MLSEDLVQQSFIKLWEHRKSIDIARVKSWLFTVAHRLLIDHYRKQKRETKVLNLMDSKAPATQENYEEKEILKLCLRELSEIQRQVLLLRDYEGYSYAEIAEIADLNLSQVKVYIFRARKKMRNSIRKLEKAN